MSNHVDILEARESLYRPLMGSVALHITVLVLIAMQGLVGRRHSEMWGDPDSLGGSAVGITAVSQIPMPARGGLPNPLASDTESHIPAPPKPEARRAPEPDPDAIAIKGREAAKKDVRRRPASASRTMAAAGESQSQIYSESGRALSSPLVGRTGSGGVGIGAGGTFGTRFGAYKSLLEQRIAQKWRTDDVDSRLRVAPPVVVTFSLYRDGSTGNVRIEQSSGNRMLDNSALRAVYEASPFPPLPTAYERNEATVEIWFQLRR